MAILTKALRISAIPALGLALACSSSDPVNERNPPTPPDDTAIPPEVRENALDWPLPGRDYRNSRATRNSRIDSRTVASLEVAWEVELPGRAAYGNASTTPLIIGDTVYLQDLTCNVYAIDRVTGDLRWRRDFERFSIGPNGVAVGWGMIYAVEGTDTLHALDLETGSEVWRRRLVKTTTDGVDIQPTVYAEMVFASTVPVSLTGIYTGGDRGILQALDVSTGDTVWEFDTVDSEDLWGNPEVNSGGGSWFSPSIDPASGLIFWGVANPAPFPGTAEFPNGTSRPGPNLYTNSVVALDVRSGALEWYRQAIPHDIFDRDLTHTMVVAVERNGRTEDIVVATGKGGKVLGHVLSTGELLWETSVGVHQNDDLEALDGPTDIWPGTFGGVLTPPSSADGVVYVATLNAPTTLSPNVPAYIGSQLYTAPGQIVAIDAATGGILWDVTLEGDPLGATTVVNDLVFTANFAGRIFALDRATGATVWTWDAPGGINAWPAVAGDTIVWPVGLAEPPRLVALRVVG